MIAVVGGGPAGLRAAEILAESGHGAEVTVFDAKASVGRKFLVAGGGGLNLTKAEAIEQFAGRYRGPQMPADFWQRLVGEFRPDALRAWAAGLGVETFAASTGRVYPSEMKAAPLLRRWVQRLRSAGVRFAMHHRWVGIADDGLEFGTPVGRQSVRAGATILALGGGSWPETGSDGLWVESLTRCGVDVAPLQPANCGWNVAWPANVLAEAEGLPVKNVIGRAGGEEVAGELLITRYGLEGGVIYQLGAVLREMDSPVIEIDLKPASTEEQLIAKLGPARRNWLAEARARWKLSSGATAIFSCHPDCQSWSTAAAVARAAKHCPVSLLEPRPIAEAISSGGGVPWAEIDENLMLRRLPGIFVAGEMIDWEAPTGGYLIHGAFASGMRAAQGALHWLASGKNG
jgi:uncharacterized flavoprotein (TIGR03862 family)